MNRSSSVVRRAAVAAAAGALALTTLLGGAAAAAPSLPLVVSTLEDWDGTTSGGPFGREGYATVGQVLTVPAEASHLKEVRFMVAGMQGAGDLTVRIDAYTWAGGKAGTKIGGYGGRIKVAFEEGDPTFQAVARTFKWTQVPAGQKVVIFVSISTDFQQAAPDLLANWGMTSIDSLAGGYAVSLDNGDDEALWTTQRWERHPGQDMALRVRFS
jgi:hypothetical protein